MTNLPEILETNQEIHEILSNIEETFRQMMRIVNELVPFNINTSLATIIHSARISNPDWDNPTVDKLYKEILLDYRLEKRPEPSDNEKLEIRRIMEDLHELIIALYDNMDEFRKLASEKGFDIDIKYPEKITSRIRDNISPLMDEENASKVTYLIRPTKLSNTLM